MGQHRPTWAQPGPDMSPRWAQHSPTWANLGPRWAQDGSTWARLGQHKPKMGPRWLNMGPTWPNMGTTCAQHRPRLLPYRQALRIMPASVQHSPSWVCAENLGPSHTISQTSLLGRRPAVRRKPLNNCGGLKCHKNKQHMPQTSTNSI